MSEPLLSRIDTVFLPVRDLEAATAWYNTHLGWPLAYGDAFISILSAGGTPLTLVRHRYPGLSAVPSGETFSPVTQVPFNFLAPEIEQVHRRFREAGIDVDEIEDHGAVQEFRFRDPDGNVLSVVRC